MRGGVQRSTESSREAPTSQRRGWLPRGPVFTIVLLVVAIVVAAAAGAAVAALFSSGAPTDLPAEVSGIGSPSDSSPEAGFARDMMVHHAQAVEMAEIVRDKTESEEIRTLAADIALTQQAQIGQMQGWLQVWDLPPTGTVPAMSWMGHPTARRSNSSPRRWPLRRRPRSAFCKISCRDTASRLKNHPRPTRTFPAAKSTITAATKDSATSI